MRKVHIGNDVYEYEVGMSCVHIHLPNGKQVTISKDDDHDFQVRPAMIKNYIIKNLINEETK
jgi:hypothetical protein